MISRRYILIFSILFPTLRARVINLDPNYKETDIDQKIILRHIDQTCDTDESVNLSQMELWHVSNNLIKSSSIKSVSLQNNYLTKIPNEMFKSVPNLQCLNVAWNNIPPGECLNFRHDNLKTFIMNHQKPQRNFDFYPLKNLIQDTSTSYFPNLESLHLNGIDFEYFNNFNQSFPRLTTLYLAENHLSYIRPDVLTLLPYNLKNLHLERNKLDALYLNGLRNLEELYLDGNPVISIEIVSNNLKTLSLSNCSVNNSSVARLLSDIIVPFLTTLDLSHNQIHEVLPNMFERIPKLEALSFSHNELSMFPSIAYLKKLDRLSLTYNFIEHIENVDVPRSLRILNLRGNRIKDIDPAIFSKLDVLEELDLSKNKLQSLNVNWPKNLENLLYLNLKSNQFKTITNINVVTFTNLMALHISDNPIATIDENAFKLLPNQCTVYVI